MADWVTGAVAIVGTGVSAVAIWYVTRIATYTRRATRDKELARLVQIDMARLNGKPLVSETAKATSDKARRLVEAPPYPLHYGDEGRIKAIHDGFFRTPVVQSIIEEIVKETDGAVSASLAKVLESRLGGKELSRLVSTSHPSDKSVQTMFFDIQREAIRRGQVILDLEHVEVEEAGESEFETLLARLGAEFDVKLPDGEAEQVAISLRERAAESTFRRLESVSGWVLIEASFTVSASGSDGFSFRSRHPVSEYIASAKQDVFISFDLQRSAIAPFVLHDYVRSLGSSVKLRVYGTVWQAMNRAENRWEIRVTPLAVY